MNAEQLLTHFDRIANAPAAIPRLRRFILDLAVRGKLVEQDPNDEPALELLKRVRQATDEKHKRKLALIEIESTETNFDLPDNWSLAPLIALGGWATGAGFPKSEQGRTQGPYFFLKISDMNLPGNERVIVTAQNRIDNEVASRVRAKVHPIRTIIFPKIGGAIATNKRRMLDRPSAIDNNCLGIIISDAIDLNWAYLLLTSLDFAEYQAGTAVPALQQRVLGRIPVGIPPRAEQHRIVAKVDELMALCDRLEAGRTERETTRDWLAAASLARLDAPDPDPAIFQNDVSFALDNLVPLTTRPDQIKALRQTILNLAVRGKLVEQDPSDEPASKLLERIARAKTASVFKESRKRRKAADPSLTELFFSLPGGWGSACLSDLVEVLNGRAYKKNELLEQGTPVLRVGNLFTSDHWYYSNLDLDENKYCEKGDLIYAWSASFGPFIWRGPRAIYHYHIWKLSFFSEDDLSKKFLYNFLLQKTRKIKDAGHGVSMVHMTKGKMEQLIVPLPPLAEQHRIVAKVDELMALCNRLEASLTTGDNTRRRLLDALLHEALSPSEEEIRQDISTITQELPDEPLGSPEVLTELTLAGTSPE